MKAENCDRTTIPIRSESMAPDALLAYQQQRKRLADGKQLLNHYQAAQAIRIFQEILTLPDPPIETIPYLSLAILLSDKNNALEEAKKIIQSALENHPEDALTHAVMARVCEHARRFNLALEHRKLAIRYSGNNPAWFAEIRDALSLEAKPGERRGLALPTHALSGWVFLWPLGVVNTLALLGLNASIAPTEEIIKEYSVLFFLRATILCLGAGIGVIILYKSQTPIVAIRNLGWKFRGAFVLAACILGVLFGLFAPRIDHHTTMVNLMGMAAIRALSEEMFFRGFVITLLSSFIGTQRYVMLVSAMFFGMYHWTFWTFTHDLTLMSSIFYTGLFTFARGIPYAWMYLRSGSIMHGVLCTWLIWCVQGYIGQLVP